MASVNKVILLGNLGRDPEVRALPNGDLVANLSLATTSRYKNKSGEMVEDTEWHRVTFFGRLAEIVEQYTKKGDPIYIEGRIKTRKYTDKDGIEKYATDIIASEMQLLGSRDSSDQQSRGGSSPAPRSSQPAPARQAATPSRAAPPPARPASGFDDMDDDIPFASSSAYYDMTTSKQRKMARYAY